MAHSICPTEYSRQALSAKATFLQRLQKRQDAAEASDPKKWAETMAENADKKLVLISTAALEQRLWFLSFLGQIQEEPD